MLWLLLASTFGGHLLQPPAQVGPPRAGCPEACPGGLWRSPRRKVAEFDPLVTLYEKSDIKDTNQVLLSKPFILYLHAAFSCHIAHSI